MSLLLPHAQISIFGDTDIIWSSNLMPFVHVSMSHFGYYYLTVHSENRMYEASSADLVSLNL